ncbi:MAG TPA: bifunctional [glutamine synthetase] adenylyltransferase/[glutamine synthetase]-adenylyl-L-tyrosine phosphorylase [Mycobacteriales bacterium]|nr:bifunctional [glutamine synthetase] adenylyltransferase/[glutamine synthetase]-adenylyl-L-tyrosine phosphorylase [Mycobacteriales bacterium]
MSTRAPSATADLVRLGFGDPQRAGALLRDRALAGLVDAPGADDRQPASSPPRAAAAGDGGLLRALADTADPDQALLQLVRFLEVLRRRPAGRGDTAGADRLVALVAAGGELRTRLLAVLGASGALGDHLVRHPEHWPALEEPAPAHPALLRSALLETVGADPAADVPVASGAGRPQVDALRVAYRRRLLALAGRDLASPTPRTIVDLVSDELADLASAALEAALAVARAGLADHGAGCRLAVIGMGKCGGRELNYVSDVDVVFVAEPAAVGAGPAPSEAAALETGTRLASALMRICSASTAEGTLWPVDAGLRPEGKDGPLVRTVASHRAYYERWAKTWEFQALLKARPVAGDLELGEQYLAAVDPLVWQAAEREHFVEDVQAMRRRVEAHVPTAEAERQLKLGPGGLRDVEFAVQLLQLVHGRAERHLRTRGTLLALEQLATYGYVGRDDAAALDTAYRDLRVLEHRAQLAGLRRTHLLPTEEGDLRRLARAARLDGRAGLEKMATETRGRVRRLHERLFYRPLLSAAARLSTDEARLTPQAARARLAALGYRDPAGALRHLEALSTGVSRRAAIQRQLLPVLLGWFADGIDPDGGLLAFRRVSDELGTTHWYLKMLRDSGAAAERMAHVLAASSFIGERLVRTPESARWLGDDRALEPVEPQALRGEVLAAVSRQPDPAAAVGTVRAIRAREGLRLAIGDVAGLIGLDAVGAGLSAATAAALEGGLVAATAAVRQARGGDPLPVRLAVIGMGRLGGGEQGYGSDADVLFVYEPDPAVAASGDADLCQRTAAAVVTELRRSLGAPGPHAGVEVDAKLRPEGRNGPLVRSLSSYAEYYRRWSLGWEAQALLRAVPVAGDPDLGTRFVGLVDPVRYPEGGLPDAEAREIRRIKARVESERLPRGVSPRRHLKLGPGGLSDVEWTVQLLQLQHGASVEALRTTSTLGGLRAAVHAGLLAAADADVLEHAWSRASLLRNALVLLRGRATDVLPTDRRDLDGAARLLGYEPGSATALEDDQLRVMRRARTVVDRVFYG